MVVCGTNMDKNIKVIFVDIDRTLTDNNKQVTKDNSAAIKEAVENGIKVVLCSGRGTYFAVKKSKDANASNYVILNNGAQIYDYEKEESIFEDPIPSNIVFKLIKKLSEEDIEYILNTPTFRYGSPKLDRRLDVRDKTLLNIEQVKEEKILQVVGETKDFDSMDKLIKVVESFPELKISNLSRSYLEGKRDEKRYYADINLNTVNKGVGINKFLEFFNLTKEQSVCFGDYINDLDMFDACGTKVAMENGCDEVKQKADFVTLTNEESGVAYYINKYILNKN